jgi:hypothetical protein
MKRERSRWWLSPELALASLIHGMNNNKQRRTMAPCIPPPITAALFLYGRNSVNDESLKKVHSQQQLCSPLITIFPLVLPSFWAPCPLKSSNNCNTITLGRLV